MYDYDKIIISMDPDIYKFRMLEKVDASLNTHPSSWREVGYGPIIDRKLD